MRDRHKPFLLSTPKGFCCFILRSQVVDPFGSHKWRAFWQAQVWLQTQK